MNIQKVVGILEPFWRFVRRHASGLLFLGIVVFGVTSVFALRANNQEMIRLRQAVFDADQKNGDVEGALQALKKYVQGHMNTGLSSGTNPVRPPIQLKYTYERLQAENQRKINEASGPAYNEAVRVCAAQGVIGGDLVTCINQQLAQGGIVVEEIPDAMYKFDFVAAPWSPDLAGLSLVAMFLCALTLLLRNIISWLRGVFRWRAQRKA